MGWHAIEQFLIYYRIVIYGAQKLAIVFGLIRLCTIVWYQNIEHFEIILLKSKFSSVVSLIWFLLLEVCGLNMYIYWNEKK